MSKERDTAQQGVKKEAPQSKGSGASAGREPPQSEVRRVRLPDGSYGIYMGETGKGEKRLSARRPRSQSNAQRNTYTGREQVPQGQASHRKNHPADRVPAPDRPMTERERRIAAERARRAAEMKRRAEESNNGIAKKLLNLIADKIYMQRMSISIDLDNILRGVIVAALVLVFALLQTTVFARFKPFGAIPDLMLPLVVAVAATEGERFGAVTGLCAALLIESIGTVGTAFLPLLYVPCGFTVGILGTRNYRDSVLVRIIYTFAAGLLRALFTVIYTVSSYKEVPAGLMFSAIVIPEFFSTFVMSVLPHAASWLCLRKFHKSRAQRIN